jgi:hypothetical protein
LRGSVASRHERACFRELREEHQRLQRRQLIDVHRCKLLTNWIGLRAGLKQAELLRRSRRWRARQRRPAAARQLVMLEAGKDVPRAIDHLTGKAREPRDLNAVAAIRAARHDLPQEDDVVLPLARRDMSVDDAGERIGEVGELVIVRGEERLRPRLRVARQDTRPRPGDAQAVEGGGAAADFIEHDEAARRRRCAGCSASPASRP